MGRASARIPEDIHPAVCRSTTPALSLFEQHHRAEPSLYQEAHRSEFGFRSVEGAVQTVAGYEAMHAIRKGQIRWLAKGMLSVRSNSSSGSLVSPPDHWSRRFDPPTPHAICDTSAMDTLKIGIDE